MGTNDRNTKGRYSDLLITDNPHNPRLVLEDGTFVNAADILAGVKVGAYVKFSDGPHLDAFGRQRVSEPTTLFDAQQEYGLESVSTWDLVANGVYAPTDSGNNSVTNAGSSVGPTNATTGLTPVSSTADGEYGVLQSRQYVRYIPGKSQFIAVTGVFADSADDIASIVLRSSTGTGERSVAQDQWNVDKFDGTGPSGFILDFTKTNILAIDAQALYAGRVRIGFEIDGILYIAHTFSNANNLLLPYVRTFNLPVRCESRTDATGTDLCVGYFDQNDGVFLKLRTPTPGGTIHFLCCSVQSEGGTEARGFQRGVSNKETLRGVGAGTPVISIRPKTTHNSKVNRGHINVSDYNVFVTGNDPVYYEIIIGGTLNGTWASVSDNSIAEVNTTATTLTGGEVLRVGYAPSGANNQSSEIKQTTADFRSPIVLSQIDSLAARQIPFTIFAYAISGAPDAGAAINWNEQTI